MDTSSASSVWYRAPKRVGKLKQRIQDLRIPSFSHSEFITSRPSLDLSHNESARLATDCLLNQGVEGYQGMLNTEGEVDFLSNAEKNYIKENVRDANTGMFVLCIFITLGCYFFVSASQSCCFLLLFLHTVDSSLSDDDETELQNSHADSQSPTLHPAMSTNSDTTAADLDLPGLKGIPQS